MTSWTVYPFTLHMQSPQDSTASLSFQNKLHLQEHNQFCVSALFIHYVSVQKVITQTLSLVNSAFSRSFWVSPTAKPICVEQIARGCNEDSPHNVELILLHSLKHLSCTSMGNLIKMMCTFVPHCSTAARMVYRYVDYILPVTEFHN